MQGKYFYREAMKQWLTQEYPTLLLPGKVLQPKSEGGNSWWERAATWPGAGASREKKQDNLEELWERRVAKSSPKMFIWLFKKFPAIRGTPSDFE